MKTKKFKTGLFFGSFNPVHIGHLAIANYMVEFHGLHQCWFVVSPQNPLKQKNTLLSHVHRYRMVQEAIDDYPKFRVSDVEFHLPVPSYTVHTLAHLEEKFPEHEFILIMGSDNLPTLHKWKNYERILEKYTLLIYPRPGNSLNPFDGNPNVVITSAPWMDVSSSFIREAIKQKKDVRFFLHPAVWRYIEEMHFYK